MGVKLGPSLGGRKKFERIW